MRKFLKKLLPLSLSALMLCVLLLAGIPTAAAASAPAVQWSKSYGGSLNDVGVCIRDTLDGGYITVSNSYSKNGNVGSNKGASDIWAAKYDAGGAIKWKTLIGGSKEDIPYCIQQTSDGGYILCGYTWSTNGSFGKNHGKADAWVIKLSSTGKIAWTKCYGTSADEMAEWIVQTKDGGYIFAGATYTSRENAWVVKLDSKGNVQWQKSPRMDTGNEHAMNIIESREGGYIFAAYSFHNTGSGHGNHGGQDAWIVKLDSKGKTTWSKLLGGSSDDYAHTIVQDYDGNYVFSGITASNNGDISGNNGDVDLWIFKLNQRGSFIWSKCFGGTGRDVSNSIDLALDGGYIVAGTVNSNDGNISGKHGNADVWLGKISGAGALQWKKCYGSPYEDGASSVLQAADGGYAFLGYSAGKGGDVKSNQGNYDTFAMKLKIDPQYKKPLLTGSSVAAASGKAVMKISASLTTTAIADVTATIYNAAGKSVAILKLASQFSGAKSILWDGKATAGNTAKLKAGEKVPILAAGTAFKVRITATNAKGSVTAGSISITLHA